MGAVVLPAVAAAAKQHHININAIPLGDDYHAELLEGLVRSTHKGQFISIDSLREETDYLIQHNVLPGQSAPDKRFELSVICVDLSASMERPFEGRRIVDVAAEATWRIVDMKNRLHG